MTPIRRKTIKGLKPGDSFTVTRTFSEADVDLFARISRDYNPVHFDERFTEAKALEGKICHGLLVAGMLTEIGGQIGWLASEMIFSFKKPVYFGDTISCSMRITEIEERGRATASARFINQKGILVLEATLKGLLPGPEEKAVMQQMDEIKHPDKDGYGSSST